MRSRTLFHTVVMWLVALAVVASCSVLWGQLTVLPTSGKSLGSATAPEPGKWFVLSSDFMPVTPIYIEQVEKDGPAKGVMWEGAAGVYAVFYFPPGDKQPTFQKVTLGGSVPPPKPPDPPDPPGTRWAVIWEETAQRTPAVAALRNDLDKNKPKERLLWLDVSNLPVSWEPYKAFIDKPLPVLAVYSGRQLLRTVPLPATAEAVQQEISR